MLKKLLLSTFLISSLMAAPEIGQAQVLFSEDFEAGNFSKWAMVWETSRWSIVADPTNSNNKVSRVLYQRKAVGHQDDNQMIIARPGSQRHLFTRAYLYFPPDLSLRGTAGTNINRKLFYWKSDKWDSGSNYWNVVIDVDSNLGIMIKGRHNTADGNVGWTLWDVGKKLSLGKWHCIETEIDARPPKGSQIVRLWVDGVLVYTKTNMNLTGASPDGIRSTEVGRQIDMSDNYVSEYRYWDDIVLSTSYVGPKGAGPAIPAAPAPAAPAPPARLMIK